MYAHILSLVATVLCVAIAGLAVHVCVTPTVAKNTTGVLKIEQLWSSA